MTLVHIEGHLLPVTPINRVCYVDSVAKEGYVEGI